MSGPTFKPAFISGDRIGLATVLNGQFLVSPDEQKCFIDHGNKRIQLSDLIEVQTTAEFEAITAPIKGKFYFNVESQKLYIRGEASWIAINPDGSLELSVALSDLGADGLFTRSWDSIGLSTKTSFEVHDSQGWDITSDARLRKKSNSQSFTVDFSDLNDSAPFTLVFNCSTSQSAVSFFPNAVPIVQHSGVLCHFLDSVYNSIQFTDPVRNMSVLNFYVRSASSITGNIALIPKINGVARDVIAIPVSATDSMRSITFDPPISGMVVLERDTADSRDTLKDIDPVTAIVGTDFRAEVAL